MTVLAALVVILVAVPLFAASVAVLGYGAIVWTRALSAVHQARAHAAEADSRISIDTAALDAARDAAAIAQRQQAAYVGPTDDELREVIFAGRPSRNGHVEEPMTTLGNEGADENENPFSGGMFNR